MIYLDNSATTFPKPECVYEALDKANREFAFNAGRGTYGGARKAFEIIEEARKAVASFCDANPDDVAFFSSATESLNIIINGLDLQDGDNVYITPFEHNAIVRPLYNIKKDKDINIFILPFNKETWDFENDKANDMFAMNPPKAVFVSHISNVTGYILPYEEIFKLAKQYNCITALDCAQSYGVLNPIIENVDFVVFAGHKSMYASFGIAGFINVNDIHLKITKSGGNGSDSLNHEMPDSHHFRYETGSPNVVAAHGLRASCEWLMNNNVFLHEKELSDLFISLLQPTLGVKLLIPPSRKSVGIVSFCLDGFSASDVAAILSSEFNICVREGYHCSPFVHDFVGSIESGTVRVSFGAFNTFDDVKVAVDAIKSIIEG